MATKEEQRIVSAKLNIYDNADDKLFTGLGKTETAVLRAVMGLINKAPTDGGRLVLNESTTMLLNSLNKEVRRIMRKSTYDDKVTAYLREFDKIDKLNRQLQGEVNKIKLTKVNLNPIKTQAVDNLSLQLVAPASIDVNLVNPIKNIMFQTITTGMTLEDARNTLNQFITGDEKRLGHIQRYVSQIARDSISQYDGLVNSVIAREYELDSYRYVGSLIEDSRAQCVRWVNDEVLPIITLDSEIRWAFNNGSGMIPGTNVENFATFRGGYNCRHMAIPFRS